MSLLTLAREGGRIHPGGYDGQGWREETCGAS